MQAYMHTYIHLLGSSAHHCRRCVPIDLTDFTRQQLWLHRDPGEADLTAAEAQLAQEALRLQQQWQQIREQVRRTQLPPYFWKIIF